MHLNIDNRSMALKYFGHTQQHIRFKAFDINLYKIYSRYCALRRERIERYHATVRFSGPIRSNVAVQSECQAGWPIRSTNSKIQRRAPFNVIVLYAANKFSEVIWFRLERENLSLCPNTITEKPGQVSDISAHVNRGHTFAKVRLQKNAVLYKFFSLDRKSVVKGKSVDLG